MFLLTDLNARINIDNMNSFCVEYNNLEDNNHRIDFDAPVSAFDSLLCNVKSISGSTSTNNKDVYQISRKLGFNTSMIGINYNSVPVLATLFGIEYESSWDFDKDLDYYTFIKNIHYSNLSPDNNTIYSSFNLYKLNRTLGIGYLISDDYTYNDSENPFSFQNNIIKKFTDTDKEVYSIYDLEEVNKYQYKVKLDSSPYIYVFINSLPAYIDEDIGKLYINNQLVTSYKYCNEGIFVFYNHWKGQEVSIDFIPTKEEYEEKILYPETISVATLNKDNFNQLVSILEKNQLDIKKISHNTLEGSIYSDDDDKYLFISVPYEKSWKAYVDDKEVKIEKAIDSFIKVKIDSGKHDIKLIYTPSGYILGIIITCISTFGFIVLIYYYKKKKNY